MLIPAAPPPQRLLQRPPFAPPDGVINARGDWDFLRERRRKLRVGVYIPFSGPAGIWGPVSQNSAVLAASEINARGGVLGREIELVVADAGGPPESVARHAAAAIADGEIDVVIGGHLSAVRVALRRAVKGRIPYVYTALYEGGETTPGVLAIGETPVAQLRPAIAHLAEARHATRWYLIGNDYVWPWLSHRAVKRYIRSAGAQVVGESFVPLGTQTHEAYLERIRAARPDIVLVSLIGTDSILFNRAFAASGLAAHILRLSSAIDETALLGIGADNAENLYSSSGFFTAVGSRASEAFQDRYQGAFGATAPVLGGVGQSSYEGFHFYAALAARAGSTALGPLAGAAEGLVYEGGRGPVSMRRHRTTMPMFLCEADGLDFRLIRTL